MNDTHSTAVAPDPQTRITQLETRIAELEAQRADAEPITHAVPADEPRSRRQMLRLAGAVVVGTAAAAVAGSATAAADDYFGSVPALADFVPAGATAIAANVTVTNTVGSGFLTVNPGGTSTIGASTINWSSGGLTLANGVILTVNANRELTVVYGGAGSAATNVIVDVNGYYL